MTGCTDGVTSAENGFVRERHCDTYKGNRMVWSVEIPKEKDVGETMELFLTQPSERWGYEGTVIKYGVVEED